VRPGARLIAAALAAILLAAPAAALAATPKVTIADIEDEVMCPVCGTLLELAESPQALREKAFVRGLIAEGKSRGEIKDTLVAQYGPAVLAQPEGSGFDISAYLVPVIAFIAAAAALAAGVWRWRSRGGDGGPAAKPPSPPRGEDAERLDADIARYDL
jgi:cytochrome c-type biogenesis protein CcmH/NrfF